MGRAKTLVALGGAMVLLAFATIVHAELQPATADVIRTAGPVEVLRKGQSQWVPAAVGMPLVDGDQIRAMSKGSADLRLTDGSTIFVAELDEPLHATTRNTIFVAENTRFAVIKLEYDAASGARNTALHLVVGKVRAEVTKASLQLVRARQSNFTISTPAGVAAVRGTVMVVTYAGSTPTQRTSLSP